MFCEFSPRAVQLVMMMMMMQDVVQAFDLESGTWEIINSKLPKPMAGIVACRVKLPQHVFDFAPM